MTCTKHQRRLAALAAAIHAALSEPAAPASTQPAALPEVAWGSCQRRLRLLAKARRRNLRTAAAELHSQLGQMLTSLEMEIRRVREQLQPPVLRRIASPGDIYRDLLALHDEFSQVEGNKRQGTLTVTTEAIELDGYYLGQFQIELQWRSRGAQPAYCVRALDPQHSSVDPDVTHPHVQAEQLCEGEGRLAIRAAWSDGRLLDFFVIIDQLLHTYNAASPYVSLDEWGGVRCTQCDYSMDEDESRCCERCETTLCSECSRSCCDCGETRCGNCCQTCSACDDDVCPACAKSCGDCHRSLCASCLQNDQRCPSCHEQHQNQQDHNEAADADAPVRAERLGETAVSA